MKLKLLFIGRPSKYKGFDTLIKSLRLIDKNLYILTVVGDCIKYKHEDINIIFLGRKDNDVVAKIIRKNDVVVVPSLYENFGNVALEAMASAKPIIASNTGGLSELVDDNFNGLLFTPNNELELKNKILIFINNPKLCKEMGCNGYEKSKKFQWKNVICLTNIFLRKLLK